jgi:putative colanic acid biosynthesis acetyltransferase WcaF
MNVQSPDCPKLGQMLPQRIGSCSGVVERPRIASGDGPGQENSPVSCLNADATASLDHAMKAVPLPSPRLADRLRRMVWNMVWHLLFRPSPVPFHGWRRLLLRLFGARVGVGAHVYPSARVWAPWNLVMEQGSCLAADTETYSVAKVHLGACSIVSQRAWLCTASHDIHDPGFPLVAAPIHVGPGAWVAAGAFLGPGVEIGAGAVVGACAVVLRDVAAGDVVAGNPARRIGGREMES